MGDKIWTAIGRDADGFCAYAMTGEALIDQVRASGEVEAMTKLSTPQGAHTIRIGEGPEDKVPCAILPDTLSHLSVITQDHPTDVMGAWARLCVAGFAARYPDWDGVICLLDSDVTHWVHKSADEIVSFASFLSPRLIALLGGSSTPDPEAMANTQSRPERLAAHLRQAEVAGNPDAITGHLLGAELSASRVYWLGQAVCVIGNVGDCALYKAALLAQGVQVMDASRDAMIAEGLAALGRHMGFAE